MAEDNQDRTTERERETEAECAERRPYTRPELIEYGSVAKLTQGTRTRQGDNPGAGFRR